MEQQLKQRLAGAIVLVSLAAIFIPIILEGPKDEWAPRDHTIPEPPELGYHMPESLPIPSPRDERPAEQPGVKPAVDKPPVPVPLPVAEPAAQKQPAKEKPSPQPTKSVTESARPQALANGWYVQVGSFGEADNAHRERDRLRSNGLDAHLQSTKTGKGTGYRVLVGPVQSRVLADKLRDKLAGAQKLKGIAIEISGPAG